MRHFMYQSIYMKVHTHFVNSAYAEMFKSKKSNKYTIK